MTREVRVNTEESFHLNPKVCAKCGGKCCKRLPGAYLPEDFNKPLLISLVEAFKSGKYAIDWWEGNPRKGKGKRDRAFYIRPAVKGSSRIFDATWKGECIFLTASGCVLSPEERPTSCRNLIPSADFKCRGPNGDNIVRLAALKWLPHTNTILKAAEEVNRQRNNDQQLFNR